MLLFDAPVTARPRLPLSIRASTASWSILFSFLTIISGAPISRSLFSLLFLFITLLYKSFKSLVANLPPSSWTIGLSSGGITGRTSSIIHSGLFPLVKNASTTSSLLEILTFFWPFASSSSLIKDSYSFLRSMLARSFLTASAPISAWNSVSSG